MRDALLVEVIKCLGYLFEKAAAHGLFYLSVRALLLDVLVETDSTNEIRDDTYGLRCFYQVIHFNDVWMVYFFEREYLTLDCLALHRVIKF
jgi:hypothetical protein